MLLEFISNEPYVQLGFLAGIVAISVAAFAHNGSKKSKELEFADKPDARAHEADMWRAKQGAIEHKK
jgi:hypothetical protein